MRNDLLPLGIADGLVDGVLHSGHVGGRLIALVLFLEGLEQDGRDGVGGDLVAGAPVAPAPLVCVA